MLRKMVISLLDIQVECDGACKGCALGNSVKGRFTSSDNRSKGIFNIIHFDVCRNMMVPSLGNFVYNFLLIDDYYRNT